MKRLWSIGIGSIVIGEAFMIVALLLEGAPTSICAFASAGCIGFGVGVLTAVDELKGSGRRDRKRSNLQ